MSERSGQLLIGCVTLIIVLILVFLDSTVTSRLKYEAFLRAQVNVLSCRSDHAAAADRICGSVPTLDSFR